jgi:predicted RNA-binding protein YlqC (UPF0109 family)
MASSIDQQFIEYIVKSLVGNPDAVKIERRIDEKGVLLELTVDPEDLGRVIGKRGATAQSLRTLLRALGTKNDARYNLKIVDNGEPRPARSSDDGRSDDSTSDNSATDAPADEPADEPDTPALPADDLDVDNAGELSEAQDDEPSDLASRTRAELADLDDLDV